MMGGGMSARKMYKAGSSNPKAMMSAKQKIEKTFKPKKKMSKKKKSFPDLNKDGKISFADVLKGRLKGKAKA